MLHEVRLVLTHNAVVGGRPPPAMTRGERAPSPAATTARPSSGSALSPALTKAAQDFEAITIAQLLQPMFDTVDTAHGAFGGGDAEAAWKPMLVDAIAQQVAARGGLGFAGPVFDALLRAQETQPGTPPP